MALTWVDVCSGLEKGKCTITTVNTTVSLITVNSLAGEASYNSIEKIGLHT